MVNDRSGSEPLIGQTDFFCIGALIALLLTEKMFADRLIGNLLPMVGLVLIGIAMVGRLWCLLYIGGRQ